MENSDYKLGWNSERKFSTDIFNHYQIINTIIKIKRKHDFLLDKRELNVGHWRQFIVDEYGGEVHCILIDNILDNLDSAQEHQNGKFKLKSLDFPTYLQKLILTNTNDIF